MRFLRLAILFLPAAVLATDPNDGISLERLGAMVEAARLIEQSSGEPVDVMELINNHNAATRNLDRHSGLLDPNAYREARIQHRGDFVGIGIKYQFRHNHLSISTVFPDGPAAAAGVRPGDQIIAVGDAPVSEIGREATIARLRGPARTKVSVTVRRDDGELPISITRDHLELPAVSDARLLDDATAYLRLSRFHGHTEAQLLRELRNLRQAGMRHLILDLRDNPGGATDVAIRIAGLFLPLGSVVCREVENDHPPEPIRTRNHNRQLTDLPLVCLVNGATASAAEILAAALRDNARTTLVGAPTFGKGVGQETTRLADGSAVKLTTTEYFTPAGHAIQGNGLRPKTENRRRDNAAVLARAREILHSPLPSVGRQPPASSQNRQR